jgi:large subunit ribosomal protein L6
MSRIGKLPIKVPSGVTIELGEEQVKVRGPKGELLVPVLSVVTVKLVDGELIVERKNDHKDGRSAHGLTRTLLNNAVEGVTKGFRQTLEIQGVGFRANKAGENLNLSLGFSHPVVVPKIEGISFTVEGTTVVHIDGFDKQRVGQVTADIRSLKPPEPYKGKGIRRRGEVVKKKVGKTGKAGKK